MAGLRLKTGPALPNLVFRFPRRGETLYRSGDLSLFPEGISFFNIPHWCPCGPWLSLKRVNTYKELQGTGLPEGQDGLRAPNWGLAHKLGATEYGENRLLFGKDGSRKPMQSKFQEHGSGRVRAGGLRADRAS